MLGEPATQPCTFTPETREKKKTNAKSVFFFKVRKVVDLFHPMTSCPLVLSEWQVCSKRRARPAGGMLFFFSATFISDGAAPHNDPKGSGSVLTDRCPGERGGGCGGASLVTRARGWERCERKYDAALSWLGT